MRKRNGKMVKVMVLGLIGTLLLSSCFPRGSGGGSFNEKEKEQADVRFKAIMGAIEKKDKAALKSMFSKKAISETNDLDENIEYLFTVMQDSMKSWERQGITVSEDNEYGEKRQYFDIFYDVKTEKEDYVLYLIECTRDDFDADGVGLYFLSIIKAEDDQKYWGGWNSQSTPGVFKPEK